jgi:hypothetical protein
MKMYPSLFLVVKRFDLHFGLFSIGTQFELHILTLSNTSASDKALTFIETNPPTRRHYFRVARHPETTAELWEKYVRNPARPSPLASRCNGHGHCIRRCQFRTTLIGATLCCPTGRVAIIRLPSGMKATVSSSWGMLRSSLGAENSGLLLLVPASTV